MGSRRSLATARTAWGARTARGVAPITWIGTRTGARIGTWRSVWTAALAGSFIALAGCPTVDLGDTPTDIGVCNPAGGLQYFQDQIYPNYMVRDNGNTSCRRAGCHVAGGNGLDYPAQVDFAADYRRTQVQLNCGSPEASPFLIKPLAGIEPHGGGDIFRSLDDDAVKIFLDWFQ
jgi:hypothetical protein